MEYMDRSNPRIRAVSNGNEVNGLTTIVQLSIASLNWCDQARGAWMFWAAW